jgi:hypothetical protein
MLLLNPEARAGNCFVLSAFNLRNPMHRDVYIVTSWRMKAICMCPPLPCTMFASFYPSNLVRFPITRAFPRAYARTVRMWNLHSTLAITCSEDLPELKIWVETFVEVTQDDGETLQTTIIAQPCSTNSTVSRNILHCSLSILILNERFQIVSEPRPNILHIQVLGQYSEIEIAALGSSWGGRWMLFSNWRWIQLCRSFSTGKKETSFRVERVEGKYIVRGILHNTISLDEAALKECWTGRLLLAESDGELMRLFNIRRRPLQFGKWTGKASQKNRVDTQRHGRQGRRWSSGSGIVLSLA